MNYDKIIKKQMEGEEIEYAILFGNENIVFIKTGANGDIYGFENKYPKMAERIHKRMGATVICSSYPETEESQVTVDKRIISEIASDMKLTEYKIYFVGTSDGGYHILSLASQFSQTDSLLCINPSFIDTEDFCDRLAELSQKKKTIVLGTEDEDYPIIAPSIKKAKYDNLKLITVPGADHRFTGMLNEFISLIDLL